MISWVDQFLYNKKLYIKKKSNLPSIICLAEPAIECHISLEILARRLTLPGFNMEDNTEELRFQTLQTQRTKNKSQQRRAVKHVKTRDRPQKSKPPD